MWTVKDEQFTLSTLSKIHHVLMKKWLKFSAVFRFGFGREEFSSSLHAFLMQFDCCLPIVHFVVLSSPNMRNHLLSHQHSLSHTNAFVSFLAVISRGWFGIRYFWLVNKTEGKSETDFQKLIRIYLAWMHHTRKHFHTDVHDSLFVFITLFSKWLQLVNVFLALFQLNHALL